MSRKRSTSTRSSKASPTRTSARSAAAKPVASAGASRRRLWQVSLLVGMLACSFATLALATYHAGDPAFSRAGEGDVVNAAGPLGALVADILLQVFGYGAGAVSVLGLVFGVRLAGRSVGGFARWTAGSALLWVLLGALALVSPADGGDAFPSGGLVGATSSLMLVELVGPVGVWIVLLGVTMVSLTWLVRVDWEVVAGHAVEGAERALPQVGRAGRRAVGGALGAGRRLGERFRNRDEVDDDLDEYDIYDETGSIHTTDPSVDEEAPATAAEAEPNETRRLLPRVPIHINREPMVGALGVATALPMEGSGRDTQADSPAQRTQSGAPELVEVEWDSTAHPDSVLPARGPNVDTEVDDEVYVDLPSNLGPLPSVAHEPVEVRPARVLPPAQAPAPARASAPAPAPPPAASDDDDGSGSDPTPANFRPKATRGEIRVDPDALVSGGNKDSGKALIAGSEDSAFELPHLGLLDEHERSVAHVDEIELRALADTLESKLEDFGVKGEVTAIRPGPVITTFEYMPAAGIKLSRIASLEDDIAMALKALRVRIVAPIPGKGVVGFEVPNKKRQTVWMRDLLASEQFRKNRRLLPIVLGKSVEGKPELADLAKAPHLLVAGTTGSGKSVGVNAMLLSMLFTRTPDELKLLLIDPKMLEFELYRDIPHLIHPVVTEPNLANAALKWACQEMDDRYRLLARWKTRNVESYNKKVDEELENWTPAKARRYAPDWPSDEPPPPPRRLPYLVIVIDELADLMMIAAKEVETSIARIAQKARAAGIHLIVATQRPEKTVVTGIIKANLPSRIAFQVRSRLDGRIILDQNGAETLLGKGDMLFLPPGVSEIVRCHGAFVSDDEVRNVCDFLREQGPPNYEAEIRVDDDEGSGIDPADYDDLYDQAVAYVVREGKASTSMIQREFKIGYNRAARMLEVMERERLVAPADGARPRKVLVSDAGGALD